METNRDDFIIAIRSAFLKKGTKQRFSLIVLLFFSITILVLGKYNFKGINFLKTGLNEFVYRATFIISVPENFIINTYKLTLSHINLYNDHKKLKIKFKALEAENFNNSFIISENKMLKKKIDDIVNPTSETLAKVLVDKQSPFLKSVIVNRGSKDGIKLGMAVLDEDFLIGKVVEVNFRTSRVLLLSDLNSKVPVTIEPNSIQSILTGTGEKFGKLQYTQTDNFSLKNGNQIYSSGSGGIFKSGIPIGSINIIDDSNETYVLFHSDFTQLQLVKMVLYEKPNWFMAFSKLPISRKILSLGPIILLYISVLNEFDFNYLTFKYFSFNFPYILIFYWSLKGEGRLSYVLVFFAGLINDVVIGLPLGISSLTYLLICVFAVYLRNITLRPSLIKDWFFFLFTILVTSSLFYSIVVIFFDVKVNYYNLLFNVLFTFLLYYFFSYIFGYYLNLLRRMND